MQRTIEEERRKKRIGMRKPLLKKKGKGRGEARQGDDWLCEKKEGSRK